jgi:hypothetical protein
LVDHLGGDLGAFDNRRADLDRIAFADQQNLVADRLGTDLEVEFLDLDRVAFLDAVLLTASLDHRVGHGGKGLLAA